MEIKNTILIYRGRERNQNVALVIWDRIEIHCRGTQQNHLTQLPSLRVSLPEEGSWSGNTLCATLLVLGEHIMNESTQAKGE